MRICGYVTSRPFGPFVMPVPAQNSCLREYANNKKLQYVLPQLEHKYEDCFMQLYSVMNSALTGDIIAMYSLEIVKETNKIDQIINYGISRNLSFYFVLENIYVISLIELQYIKRLWKIQNSIAKISFKNKY